jgi:hypothetical protein
MEEVGYRGEAVVYKHLRDSGLFRRVTWSNQGDSGEEIRVDGEVFFMRESGEAYDIKVETFDRKEILVEVKSSCRGKYDGRACHYFGGRQLDVFLSANDDRQSVLALVFKARDIRPDIEYLAVGPFTTLRHHT